jgi:hypothetical protein
MTMLGAPGNIRVVRRGLLEGGAVFMFIQWEKSFRRPVKIQGDLTHLCTHEPLYYGEQGPGMVVFDFTSRPYTRVTQPFGLAGNALRLHCRTLIRDIVNLPPACINNAVVGGGCCLIILAGTTTAMVFGVLEWALYYLY